MEMAVCDEAAAQKLGGCLTKYFLDLDGGSAGEEKSSKAEPVKTSSPAPSKPRAPSPKLPSRQTSSASSGSRSSGSWMNSTPVASGDARSQSNRRQDEMSSMFPNRKGGGNSIKDRMAMFNNNNTMNFDPVHFAMKQNKQKQGE